MKWTRAASALHWRPKRRLPSFRSTVVFLSFLIPALFRPFYGSIPNLKWSFSRNFIPLVIFRTVLFPCDVHRHIKKDEWLPLFDVYRNTMRGGSFQIPFMRYILFCWHRRKRKSSMNSSKKQRHRAFRRLQWVHSWGESHDRQVYSCWSPLSPSLVSHSQTLPPFSLSISVHPLIVAHIQGSGYARPLHRHVVSDCVGVLYYVSYHMWMCMAWRSPKRKI